MWLLPIQCEKWQKFPRDALIPACPCHFCTWKWCCWPFRCQQLRKVTISTTFDNSAPVLTHFWQCSSWLQINKSVDLGLLLLRCRCPPSHIHSGSKFPHKGNKEKIYQGMDDRKWGNPWTTSDLYRKWRWPVECMGGNITLDSGKWKGGAPNGFYWFLLR